MKQQKSESQELTNVDEGKNRDAKKAFQIKQTSFRQVVILGIKIPI